MATFFFLMNHISVSLILTSAGWLVPNHYLPWVSAWSEFIAISGLVYLLFAQVLTRCDFWIAKPLLTASLICAAMITVQFSSGKILFFGDAMVAIFYVAIWTVALACGGALRHGKNSGGALVAICGAWLTCAIISAAIGLIQLTGSYQLGLLVADMPNGARPFGNIAQPNHLSTICFIGICSALIFYEKTLINRLGLFAVLLTLFLGLVASQSRTGWVQCAVLLAALIFFKRKHAFRLSSPIITSASLMFFCLAISWQTLCEIMLISPGRTLDDKMAAGVRLPYWNSMLDAIAREPISGYGWLQVGMAQQRIADSHPAHGTLFLSSHNIVLDLLLWNGVIVGAVVTILFCWWFAGCVKRCSEPSLMLLVTLILGCGVHALLEMPHEYAYFLIPAGLACGFLDSRRNENDSRVSISTRGGLIAGGTMSLAIALIAFDYIKIEENYRALRLESAKIGVGSLITPVPEVILLDQLQAFLKFAHTEASTAMTDDEVYLMGKVASRFGHAPVLMRYALASGLNGRPDTAKKSLLQICKIHGPTLCSDAIQNWLILQQRYPNLPEFPNGPEVNIN